MKNKYFKFDYDRQLRILDKTKELNDIMIAMECPAVFLIDPLGELMRVFVFPEKTNDTQIRSIKKTLSEKFNIPKWKRSFREDEGTCIWRGDVTDYYDGVPIAEKDLLIFIESVPPPKNCKLIKKEKTVEYFEMDCSK